jgi:secreted PhoX family phosphatase
MMKHRRRPGRAARVLGTLNNCASGITPWGTYLSCEENFIFYFKGGDNPRPPAPLGPAQGRLGYRWHEHDERFDAAQAPQRVPTASAGWSRSTPDPTARRSSAPRSGRAAHEGAWVA